MKLRFLLIPALFFFCGALLFPLDKGKLAVNNCPAEATVVVCENDDPETLLDLVGVLLDIAAVGLGDNSPFTLSTKGGNDFTETGTYLVVVIDDSVIYFIENVRFNKGSATVDFKKMKSQTDLPLY